MPDGIAVEVGDLSLFGHRRDWGRETEDGPLIRLRVLSIFGTVDVWRVPAELGGDYGEITSELTGRRAAELSA